MHREAGIHLGPAKKALVFGRLAKRVRQLGLRSFGAYYRRITGPNADPAELTYMLDCICTNETHFFREPRHFHLLEQSICPRWRAEADAHQRGRLVRVWSAACSTGEEPYTLAMVLARHLPPEEGWQIRILATDLSTKVLARAREAIWPLEKSKEIPDSYRKAYMLRGTGPQEGKMRAGPEIRALVEFQRMNLRHERYEVRGPFDLIFCRNVLIYFDQELKRKVIDRLLDRLAPDGHLFLGSAETLNGLTDRVKTVQPAVYRLQGAGAHTRLPRPT